MKKHYSILGLGLLLPLLLSCQKEDFSGVQTPVVEEGSLLSFRAVSEKAARPGDGKTTVDDATGVVAWAEGDAVKFVYEVNKTPGYVTSKALTSANIDATGGATFSAVLPETFAEATASSEVTSRHLYAVYPSSIEVDYSTASSFHMTVPATQDGTFAHAGIAVAKWNSADVDAPLEFKNFCGLFRLTVNDASVRTITVSSKSYIAGKVDVSFTGPKVISYLDCVKEITLNVEGAGTYYIAMLPGELDGLSVAAYNASGALIGDVSTAKTVALARRQLRSMGTLETSSIDRYFVKPDGAGTKDGSSWDNAADYAGFQTKVTENSAMKVYMSAGTYAWTAQILPGTTKTAADIKIYGGYPATATGTSLSGRDTEVNATVFDGGSTGSRRLFTLQSGDWAFDGLSFKNFMYNGANGTALQAIKTNSCTVSNCTFDNCYNKNTKANQGGGAIRVDVPATFTKCTFTNNKADQSGGVGCIQAKATFVECLFEGNTATKNGGVFCTLGNGEIVAESCVFKNNTAVEANGGVVEFYTLSTTGSSFTNCIFEGNKALAEGSNVGLGAAIGSAGTYSDGLAVISKCLFKDNAGYGSGAVWARAANYRITDCTFIDNDNTNGGSAISVDGVSTPTVYVDGCYFTFTKENIGKNSVVVHNTNNSSSASGYNNCVFAGSWGGSGTTQVRSYGGHVTVSNCTLLGQSSTASVVTPNDATSTVELINCIVSNAASHGLGAAFQQTSGTIDAKYTLYSKLTSGTVDATCLAGIVYKQDDASATPNFPCTEPYWYKSGYEMMLENNQSASVPVSDVRETLHYYPWDGTVPEVDGNTFTMATYAQMSSLVSTADAGFATWLGDRLGKDIRGVSRDVNAVWPGSYQKGSTEVGLSSISHGNQYNF